MFAVAGCLQMHGIALADVPFTILQQCLQKRTAKPGGRRPAASLAGQVSAGEMLLKDLLMLAGSCLKSNNFRLLVRKCLGRCN